MKRVVKSKSGNLYLQVFLENDFRGAEKGKKDKVKKQNKEKSVYLAKLLKLESPPV